MRVILVRDRRRKGAVADESDVLGGSDEKVRGDETQKEILRRTAVHIILSPNPAQLEMHILANHGADKRFAFSCGRWSRVWKLTKELARRNQREARESEQPDEPSGSSSQQGLMVEYGGSEESNSSQKPFGMRDLKCESPKKWGVDAICQPSVSAAKEAEPS